MEDKISNSSGQKRKFFNNISATLFNAFIKLLELDKNFVLKKHKPIEGKCYFDRYAFESKPNYKHAINWDSRAEKLTIDTATKYDEIFDNILILAKQDALELSDSLGAVTPKGDNVSLPASQQTATTRLLSQERLSAQSTSLPSQQTATTRSLSQDRLITQPTKSASQQKNTSQSLSQTKASAQPTSSPSQKKAVFPSPIQERSGSQNNVIAPTKTVTHDKQNTNNIEPIRKIISVHINDGERETIAPTKANIPINNTNVTNLKKAEKLPAKPKNIVKEKSEKIAKKIGESEKEKLQNLSQKNIPIIAEIERSELPDNYKNGLCVKNFNLDRLEGVLKALKQVDGVMSQTVKTEFKDTPNEVKTYGFTQGKDTKVYLRYFPKKAQVQLQGKRSGLYSEIQILLSKDENFDTAVSSHITLVKEENAIANSPTNVAPVIAEKKSSQTSKTLKKILNYAFDFLSEQSRIEIAYGLIDLENVKAVLSDNSILLVPPFRGLEKFIFDLQQSVGITVKMIGQAYEKDDAGKYMLKLGYRKRINSVVFNEVMSSLYGFYFENRHLITHSDYTLSMELSRTVMQKSEAKIVFDKLIELLNYNCKKLIEINHSMQVAIPAQEKN